MEQTRKSLEIIVGLLCACLLTYVIIQAITEGRYARAFFFVLIGGALSWAISSRR